MEDYAIKLINEPQNSPSFDELYSAHHQQVLLAAYRVAGNLPDAEDILQTVFLRLLNRSPQADYRDCSAAYLCRAAINGGLDLLRSRKRAPTESLGDSDFPSATAAADSDIHTAEQRRHLRTALSTLDQRAAEVFALRVFEDFSNTEIAHVLDMSSNNVAVTFHKARTQLQEILGELEGEDR